MPTELANKQYEQSGLADTIRSISADLDGRADEQNTKIAGVLKDGGQTAAENYLKNDFKIAAHNNYKDL